MASAGSRVLHLLGWLLIATYLVYGVRRFRGLFSSQRYLRRAPASPFWGLAFWRAETWTAEGLALRNQLLAWQLGWMAVALVVNALW